MPLPKEQAWFSAKTYGWGWGLPKRREGWLVMVGYVLSLIFPGIPIAARSVVLYVAYAVLMSAVLTLVLYWKGEEPRWRWGKDE